MKNIYIYKTVLSGMFLALALILPLFTANIREIGNFLLPMHLPVMLCGVLCGPIWGLAVGIIAPIMRSLIFSMPVLFPNSIAMAIELACYGVTIGLVYRLLKNKPYAIFISLPVSMLIGRIIWGISSIFLYGMAGKTFTLSIFFTRAFTEAVPGIIAQFIIVPIIILTLKNTKLLK